MEWIEGPALGNDPMERGEVLVGDKFLVLVGVQSAGRVYCDPHVIQADETQWLDADGEHWSAWDWSDVEYYIKLDKDTMPPL